MSRAAEGNLCAQAATCALTKVTFTGDNIPHTAGNVMIGFICVFVACFAASWGPLGWLVSHPVNYDSSIDPQSETLHRVHCWCI